MTMFAGLADRGEGAGQRYVVDVVAGGLGERPVLAPSGHPAIDEARISAQHHIGAQAQALHHAGPETLDDHIRLLRRVEAQVPAVLGADIHGQLRPAPIDDRVGPAVAALPLNAQDVGAQVRQQHRAVRPWANAGEFDDPQPDQRTGFAGRRLLAHRPSAQQDQRARLRLPIARAMTMRWMSDVPS